MFFLSLQSETTEREDDDCGCHFNIVSYLLLNSLKIVELQNCVFNFNFNNPVQ